MTLENLSVSSQISTSICTVVVNSFEGCYSCLHGARLSFTCKSDADSTDALITCPSTTLAARCDPNGHANTAHVSLQAAAINEECEVTCDGGKTMFRLSGTLHFVRGEVNNAADTAVHVQHVNEGLSLSAFSITNLPGFDIFNSLFSLSLFYSLAIGIALIFAVFITLYSYYQCYAKRALKFLYGKSV